MSANVLFVATRLPNKKGNDMSTTQLHWVKSIDGGMFTFTPAGNMIKDIAGAWFVFDMDDVFVAQYATRDEAAAVTP
jgi:hypothetical protein